MLTIYYVYVVKFLTARKVRLFHKCSQIDPSKYILWRDQEIHTLVTALLPI